MCESGPATGLPYWGKGRSLAPMIRHIVLWRMKSIDLFETIRAALEAPRGRIPGLPHIEVGRSFNTGRRAADFALVCDFENAAALADYQTPASMRSAKT